MSTTDKGEPCFAFVQIREPVLRSQANVKVTVISHLGEIGEELSSRWGSEILGKNRVSDGVFRNAVIKSAGV